MQPDNDPVFVTEFRARHEDRERVMRLAAEDRERAMRAAAGPNNIGHNGLQEPCLTPGEHAACLATPSAPQRPARLLARLLARLRRLFGSNP